MTDNPTIRAFLAIEALKHEPPLVRESLIEQREFRERYRLSTNATVSVGGDGLSFQRSDLFKGMRTALGGETNVLVSDANQRDWSLRREGEEGDNPVLVVYRGEARHILRDFSCLSPNKEMRLRSLDKLAYEVNFPRADKSTWQMLLSQRELDDEEVDQFLGDFRDTPVGVARSIRAEVQSGESSVASLVPSSRKYFSRLVGEYDGSESVKAYSAGAGSEFIGRLLAWRPYEGFLYSLYLSSHSSLTSRIEVGGIEREDLVRAFEFLGDRGDKLSQLGAVEVGLRVLPERPEIEPALIKIIEAIRDDEVESSVSNFKLLSALFVLVDGQMSWGRVMPEVPPFFRRLASLAQAALIQRQVMGLGISIDHFFDWAYSIRGEQFLLQSFADMRTEPRWPPDFAAASQMKADFLGRMIIAGEIFKNHIFAPDLRNILFGSGPESLASHVELPKQFFPGPLEGNEESPLDLPEDVAKEVERQVGVDEVELSSFTVLVNAGLIFRVELKQAELAAKALKLGDYRLANVEDRLKFIATLKGLAVVAAVSRGKPLADELRILVRRYRRDPEYTLSIDEALRVCLVASASRKDIKSWCDFVGDWLTELAFEEFHGDEGTALESHLQCLLHAVPDLWRYCGRADAALKAYCGH